MSGSLQLWQCGLKSGSMTPAALFFFHDTTVAICGLWFHVIFRVDCSISLKNAPGILIGNFSSPWAWYVFPFVLSSISFINILQFSEDRSLTSSTTFIPTDDISYFRYLLNPTPLFLSLQWCQRQTCCQPQIPWCFVHGVLQPLHFLGFGVTSRS